ncbi:MAG: ferritin family protein [Deltaproteobacteria bacterium]|nr:ferritin family protein [Deltaproteobacteria bacterium]MBW1817069.1 ferritin family protein [Deltaproteobacteria bacterium]MBW2285365.1 ferritin family protein [Deltaproteobacteria bacterium]
MFTSREIIDLAVRIEKNGEAVYRKAMNEVSDLSLQSLLRRFADDEAEHTVWFSELLSRLPDGPAADEALQDMAKSILEGILGDQSFSLQEADFSRMEHVDQLIGTALEFEKDTILFYEMIGAMIQEPDIQARLREIIEEEQRHVRQLEKLLISKP